MSINLAVIGAGKIFQNFHLNAILNQPEFKVKYIVDLNESLAKKQAEQIEAIPLNDASKIKDCDMCFIATPPSTRAMIFDTIKDKKMDIVFEKPIAFNFETAKDLTDSINACGKSIYVTQTRRFFPNLALVRKLLSTGLLGVPKQLELYEGGVFGWVTESNYMSNPNPQDMGVVHDIGSHVFDYLTNLLADLGIQTDEATINSSIVDFDIMANNFYCNLNVGGIDVKVRLSRNILLSNQFTITFQNGAILTTESGYSNSIFIKKNSDVICIDVKDEDIAAPSFESIFDNLWCNIVAHKLKGEFKSKYFNVLSNTVLPSVRLLDRAISERKVHTFDNFFNTYGHERI